MTTQQVAAVVRALPSGLRCRYEIETPNQTEDRRIETLARDVVAVLLDERRARWNDVLTAYSAQRSEILRRFPELAVVFDDDGLLRVARSSPVTFDRNGVLYQDVFFQYHPFLTLGFGGLANHELLGALFHAAKDLGDGAVRIAVDHRYVGERAWFEDKFYRSRWLGPPFDLEKLDDPGYIGLTAIHPDPPDETVFVHNEFQRTEFYWSYSPKDAVKTFQAEELSAKDRRTFDGWILNRYIHSERDIQLKQFRHIDGAVFGYSQENHRKRCAASLGQLTGHLNTAKTKTWRVDGNISIEIWSELFAFQFTGNPSVIEYLSPDVYARQFKLNPSPKASSE